MSLSTLLEALQGNYGEEGAVRDDTDTVRGLLSFCKRWPSGGIRSRELEKPCALMASRLRAEAFANHRDLDTNPNLAPVVSGPMQRMSEAYLSLAELLEEMPSLADQEQREDYLESLESFEEERQAILDAKASLEVHISGQVALCPCCGGSGQGPVCTSCDLLRLYPDPQAAARKARSSQRANLSGVYGDVYKAQLAVSEGKAGLERLEDTLPPLEDHLRELALAHSQVRKSDLSEAEEAVKDFATVLDLVRPEIDRATAGIARLRLVTETRRMADLYRGWDDIFDAARVIDGGLRQLRAAYGASKAPNETIGSLDLVDLSAA
jgi:hypothetical protein